MSFSVAPLLLHNPAVPEEARSEIRLALEADSDERRERLTSAARILYAETGLDCADAKELVGLGGDPAMNDCTCG
jgi:hypothetical protein